MAMKPVYFVHISDTHIGPTRDYRLYGLATLPCAERIIDAINSLPTKPDFVIHTGDVVETPDPDSYKLAAEVFSRLSIPMYFVTGNHDTSTGIRQFLSFGPKEDVGLDEDLLSYTFDSGGFRFVTLDSRGPNEIDPHGLLPASQLRFIQSVVQSDGPPLIIFIHFPPLKLDSVWFDRDMLMLNGEDLHKVLIPAGKRVRGVFFGHVHRGIQIVADGLPYTSVASAFRQFTAWPGDTTVKLDGHHPPSFNFVTLLSGQTIVKEHTVPRP